MLSRVGLISDYLGLFGDSGLAWDIMSWFGSISGCLEFIVGLFGTSLRVNVVLDSF